MRVMDARARARVRESARANETIDIIAKDATNFCGRAVYYPNYGTRPPYNGIIRAVRRSCSTLGATALLLLLSADSCKRRTWAMFMRPAVRRRLRHNHGPWGLHC